MKLLYTLILLLLSCSTEPETTDCAGVEGGNAYLDDCDVCDAETTNDCVQDECGIWGGDNSSCYYIQENGNLGNSYFNLYFQISQFNENDFELISDCGNLKKYSSSSSRFEINNDEVDFYFESSTNTIGIINKITNAYFPDGTGEYGFDYIDGNNNLKFYKDGNLSIDYSFNHSMDESFANTFIIPNPFLGDSDTSNTEISSSIYFTNLPIEAIINIFDSNGDTIEVINHFSQFSGYESFDCSSLESGIYPYKIYDSSDSLLSHSAIINTCE